MCRLMRASRSSELRSWLGPMAKSIGEAAVTATGWRRQTRQVALTIMSWLSVMVVEWMVSWMEGSWVGSVLPLLGRLVGGEKKRGGKGTYVVVRGLTVTLLASAEAYMTSMRELGMEAPKAMAVYW